MHDGMHYNIHQLIFQPRKPGFHC